MNKYSVTQFDGNTFIVIDRQEQREICICSNYDNLFDAENRARKIASLLNEDEITIQNEINN